MSEKKVRTHKDLKVYDVSFKAGMEVYYCTKAFPRTETYSLTDQIRRSSRSVSSNVAEAFRKRRYPKVFIAKLSDAEGEAAETQVWLDYAFACSYLKSETYKELSDKYDHIIAMRIKMIQYPEKWSID
jgi:four helix bundle protein